MRWPLVFMLSIHHLSNLSPNKQAPWYSPHFCLAQTQKHLLHHNLYRPCHLGVKNYIIKSKQGKSALEPHTNKYSCACTLTIDPSLLPPSEDGFFTGYTNSNKAIIYLDSKIHFTKRTFHCYIDEYDVKLHPYESMSLGALISPKYPSGVYQPVTIDGD